jgi:hypothetical protein
VFAEGATTSFISTRGNSMVKILFSYDMMQGREEECQRYVMQTLAPGLARLGLPISDAWYTLWGEHTPQILGGGLMEDQKDAARLIHSSEWETLIEGLEPFVENFRVRVVEASGRIQF